MESERFDYIIVGAGSAGCVLANRLSEDPATSVLLLEAGGSDKHVYLQMPVAFLKALLDPRFTWRYMSEPEPHMSGRRVFIPRGRVLGGSSSINGMFYMRGHPSDFDQWRQMGAQGWSYADVLPYFRRMERSWRSEGTYHGGSGPVTVRPITARSLLHEPLMAAAEAAGFSRSDDLAAETAEGFARGEATIDARGRRVSAATAYLKPAMKRANLTVRTGALARRVTFEGRRATGVEYEIGGEARLASAAREVILSGGAYNSPHLLMLSGIGPAEHLRAHGIEVVADRPGVGRNLSEHATASVEFEATRPVTFIKHLRIDRLALAAAQWAVLGTGPLATQLNSCNIVVRTDPSLDRPDIQVMANPIRFDARVWGPGVGPSQDHVFWAGVVGLHPNSRGWVELKSPDAREIPAVTLNLLSDPADLATLRRGVRAVRRIYRTPPQAELVGAERAPGVDIQSDEALDAYLRATTVTSMHPVGTCAIGIGAEAVVDPKLRVIGVEGLRVVDASVMPTVPGGNTNAATMMIGEKASDLIRGRSQPRAAV